MPFAILQAELARLLYPVFIHCYLHLIEKEATEDAAQLMGKHKKRFSEVEGASSRTRLQARIPSSPVSLVSRAHRVD